MNDSVFFMIFLVAMLLAAGCSEQKVPSGQASRTSDRDAQTRPVARWYTQEQVQHGYALFQTHCASCHKRDASGTPNWKEPDAQGRLPPPPLNGTAHAWHHPLALLRRIVRNGGIPMGGSMPPFKEKLSAEQIDAILAWVQSHWSDRIYAAWSRIDRRTERTD